MPRKCSRRPARCPDGDTSGVNPGHPELFDEARGTAAGDPRFRTIMRLANSNLLPVMGVLTIVAGAVGLQLGESAIAQIDPIHFQGPAPTPRDVSRDPLPPLGPSYASAYGWAQSEAALAAECGDCAMSAAPPAPAAFTAVASTWEPVHGAAPEPRHIPVSIPSYEPREQKVEHEVAGWREVTRYTSYQVAHDDPAVERVVIETEPQGEAGL